MFSKKLFKPTRLLLAVSIGMCALHAASLPAFAQTLADGEKARKLWEGAYSRFQGQSWDQAKPLMEDFVKQCIDHENAPQAFMALAVCKLNTKDVPGYEAATEEVMKRFPLSAYWFAAYSSRMQQALTAKQPEQYIKLLEAMLARTPEAPSSLPNDVFYATLYPHYWHQDGRRYPCDPYAYMLSGYINWDYPNWILTVPKVATTPDLAKRALAAMSKTLGIHKKDMPPEWQMVHVALLRQSGQDQVADKQYQDYLADWGDDPRASAFLVLMANHAQAVNDDKTADECWEVLLKKYPNVGGLGIPSFNRLAYLQGKDRFDDYLKLMPVYFKTDADYSGYRAGQVAGWCIGMAQRKADAGDVSRCAPAVAAIEASYGLKDNFGRQRNILLWKIDLLIRQKDAAGAAKLAEELISDKQWCAESYASIKQWAAANEPFKALVESANKKWGIPELDPKSKPGELLEQIKTRLKNEEPRFAEETGEEMWNNHRADGATIEAVKALIDYYFAKLTPDLRDKWMDRMISQYKSHPVTQAVLITRMQAEQAAKNYDKLAVAIDTLFSRFPPTMLNPDYYSYRMGCFSAAKDSKGALEYARKNYGATASAGDINAIHRIINAVGEANMKGYSPDNRAGGEAWMAFGKTLGDSRAGIYCTANAWNVYFWNQNYAYYYGDRICMPEGKALTDALMAQKFDPDVQWRMAFGDINYLAVSVNIKPAPAEAGKPDTNLAAAQEEAKKMYALLGDQRLKAGQKIRDLSMRLDFYGVGAALGRAHMLKEADDLAGKLKAITFTERDEHAIEILLGAAHGGAGDFAAAGDHFLNVVHDERWQADTYGLLTVALNWLRQAKSPKVQGEVERYINNIPNVQEMIPRIIHDQMGQAAYDRLKARYPHSQALYEMNDAIEKARHPSPTPTPAAGPKK